MIIVVFVFNHMHVKKVAVETLETFMEYKIERHEKEVLPFTKAVSDLMDLRNWEIDD